MAYRLDVNGNASSFRFGIKTCTYTNNSWSSWSNSFSVMSAVSNNINCINDNGADIFVAVGDGGKIVRSTNKGVSWTPQLLALRRT
jgi:hypothetical protein